MQVQISARDIEISTGTRQHFEDSLLQITGKFAGRPTDAHVTIVREAQNQQCEITVHLSTGLTIKAKSSAENVSSAFETAREKLAKQLRRYKRRLKSHQRDRTTPVTFSGALTSVLAPPQDESEEEETDGLQPVIIAETETKIPMLSVGEAVMQMELAESSMLVFRNQSHGRVNVVHVRDDGNIGWIDPTLTD